MLYGFCSKFHGLSSSERIWKIRYVSVKLQLVKPCAFFEHSVCTKVVGACYLDWEFSSEKETTSRAVLTNVAIIINITEEVTCPRLNIGGFPDGYILQEDVSSIFLEVTTVFLIYWKLKYGYYNKTLQTFPGQDVSWTRPFPDKTFPGQSLFCTRRFPGKTFPGKTFPGQTFPA